MRIVRVVRNVDFITLFDSFFISSVATVLLTRFYLEVTGYPQIGGSALHISHLLPGSILMLIALLVMLSAINRSVRDFSAVVGGIGFGLVWDELGKFITNDNNYFFKPTVGLIYVTFVLMYLTARYIGGKKLTEDDYLANVLDLLKEAAIKDLDPREFAHAKDLMEHVSKEHPMYDSTMKLLKSVKPSTKREPLLIDRLIDLVKNPLVKLSKWPHFTGLVLIVSVIYGLVIISAALFYFYGVFAEGQTINFLKGDEADFIGGVSALLSAIYVLFGAHQYINGHKFYAYRLFEVAFLINIFVGQVILFFKNATVAILGLLTTMILLLSVKILVSEEHHHKSTLNI